MKRNVSLILGAVFIIFAAQTMVSVLVPFSATRSGLSASIIGLLVSIPLGLGLLVDIPIAKASDLLGRRPAIIAGGIVGTIAAITLALGEDLGHLVAGSVLFGLALSLLVGPALALVTEVSTHENHARVQGFNGAVQGLSALMGAGAVGILLTSAGTSVSFVAVAILIAATIGLAAPIREQARSQARLPSGNPLTAFGSAYRRALAMLFQEPTLMMAAAAASLYGLVFLIVGNAFAPVYLVGAGHSSADAANLLAVRSTVGAALSLTFGFVVVRTGMVRLILAANALGVIGIGLIPLMAQSDFILVAFALQGIGVAYGPATVNLLVTSATSESERAIGFSATMLAARVTGTLLPIALGVTATVGGYAAFFLVSVVAGLLLVAAIAVLARRARASGKRILYEPA